MVAIIFARYCMSYSLILKNTILLSTKMNQNTIHFSFAIFCVVDRKVRVRCKIVKLQVKYLYSRLKCKIHSAHAYTNIVIYLGNKRLIIIYTQRCVFPVYSIYLQVMSNLHTHILLVRLGVKCILAYDGNVWNESYDCIEITLILFSLTNILLLI